MAAHDGIVWMPIRRAATTGETMKFLTLTIAALLALASCAPTPDQSRRNGEHEAMLAEYNGLIRDRNVSAYVERVGRRIIAATPEAGADWPIYVLDTPQANAYVLRDGSIYFTRGLLMLANSEAELAGVMAHEIAHLIAQHSLARDRQMASVGEEILGDALIQARGGSEAEIMAAAMAAGNAFATEFFAFTRSQEADADRRGLGYLTNAGYAPTAMIDFLEAMTANGQLEARLAGRSYDPARADVLASHPASAARLASIRAVLPADTTGEVGRDTHLDMIDGLIWGPDGVNGLIRDHRWIDIDSGLSVAIPKGLTPEIGPFVVRAASPDGRYMSFARDISRGETPGGYLTQVWLPSMNPRGFAGKPSAVTTRIIGGNATAYVDIPLSSLEGAATMRLTAVDLGDEILQFIMIAPAASPRGMDSLFDTVESLRILPPSALTGLVPTRLRVVTVAPGQTLADMVAQMDVDRLAREQFLALNNLDAAARLEPGQRLKILGQ